MYLLKNKNSGAKTPNLQLVKPEHKSNEGILQNKLLNLIELCRVVTGAHEKDEIIKCMVINLSQYLNAGRVYFVEKLSPRLANVYGQRKGKLKSIATPRLAELFNRVIEHPQYCSSLELLQLNFDSKYNRVYIIPLINDSEQSGYILCLGDHNLGQITKLDEEIIKTFANNVALALSHISLSQQVKTDYLTQLANRASFIEAFENSNEQEQRALIVFDLDHFKKINDNHGHSKGDEVLRQVGKAINESIGPTQIAARLGGEEFAILAENLTYNQAQTLALSLRKKLAQINGDNGEVTASFGIGLVAPETEFSFAYEKVDQAMYQAKKTGRNKIVRAQL